MPIAPQGHTEQSGSGVCPQVTDINAMFSDAKYFDQDLSKWNMDKVTDMDFIFRQASAFNRDMFMWNVDKVMYMRSKWEAT